MDNTKFEKTSNIILNLTNIFSTMGAVALGDITKGFVDGMGNMINDVIAGDKESGKDKVNDAVSKMKKSFPNDLKKHVDSCLSGTNKFLYPAVKKHKDDLLKSFTDEFCDEGIKVVDKHDFNISKLTEKLDEDALMGYMTLALAESPKFVKMIEELMAWFEKYQKIIAQFAGYLPPLTTNLDTGEVRVSD